MVTATTNGIQVSVEAHYQPFQSKPVSSKFVFSYTVTITNLREEKVQLLTRCWHIFDSGGDKRVVEGEGVVGKQPIIEPQQHFQYASWCPLNTEIGKMHGTFYMYEAANEDHFEVFVPEFSLIANFKEN